MSLSVKIFVIVLFGLFSLQCSTVDRKNERVPLVSGNEIQKRILHSIKIEEIDKNLVYRDLNRFRVVLQHKRNLSEEDWKLHDSLLNTYTQLKYRPRNGVVTIPGKTKVRIPLKSYCLDGEKAPPQANEVFHWKKADNKFTYLSQVLKLSAEKKVHQETLQNILWNLKNETVWEEYPDSGKEILKSIDPQAPINLPSNLKSKLKREALEQIQRQLPESTKEAIDLAEGQYHDYQDFQQSLESRQSTEDLPENKVSPMEGTSLHTDNQSDGFSNQEVTFYNASDNSQSFDLSEYYQEPFRKDVQPLGGYFGLDSLDQLYRDLEKLLFGDMVRIGLGFTPVLGDLIDLYEASIGKNFFNDDWLTSEERFLSAMGVLAGNGQSYRYASKILYAPPSYVRDIQKKYRHIKNTESYKGLEKLSQKLNDKGIPDEWPVKVTKVKNGQQGLEYTHPDNEHAKIRAMPGNPTSRYESSRKPYVKVQKDGNFYDKKGIKVEDESDGSHIPLEDFDFSVFPWSRK